ncbi:MFS transporter [Salinispora vitiensis]|uniref:MFS transporter n=1 Tax=Salinispora vitiensis TaxID=999544 RepID=UPI0003698BBB|nr:MFS transporter [Salinispora vitiensis]
MSRDARSAPSTAPNAAALTRAPAEVVDFLVPLWATAELGATPAQVGAVVAVEAALSLVARPLAGILSDRFDRGRIAALGAILYAISLGGYALAPNLAAAFGAAAVGGVGGALFWVAVRAKVGETGGVAAYGQLLAAEGQGAFVGFIGAFVLLDWLGYPAVFAAGGVAALAAAAVLLSERSAPRPRPSDRGMGQVGRKLMPLLALTAVTATAEAGVGLLLLLHLQREFDLSPVEIATVFAPGFLVFILLAGNTHKVTRAIGRGSTLGLALIASAATAGGLALAPDPWLITVIWAGASVCFAAAIPVQEATVAEASGAALGRGMGLYEGAQLVGALIGPAAFGLLYGAGGWRAACFAAAGVLLVAALLVPFAVASLGLPSRPRTSPRETATTAVTGTAAGSHTDETRRQTGSGQQATPDVPTGPDLDHARKERVRWFQHLALFVAAQAGIWFAGDSWIQAKLRGMVPDDAPTLMTVSRIWVTVLIVDFLWSFSYTIWPRQKRAAETSAPAADRS